MKKIINLLLTSLLLIISTLNTVYADDGIIHIKNYKDWDKLAKECELDVYSNKIVVKLDNDIVFDDNFETIPYFNGTFNGNNHKISGIVIDSSLINDGIFRITGKESNIYDLQVEFTAKHDSYRLGFVGYNQGKITNVSINAKIDAKNQAGMVAGYNAVSGKISGVKTRGTISGKHIIGGIVGENYGRVSTSTNDSFINTEVEKEDLDISTLTIESLTSANTISNISDIGGICGSNFGIIEDTINNGDVGHEHLGYNIGGIAGSQSGYIYNSKNYGNIDGRKEVGGIVGQMEPAMALIFTPDYLQIMKSQLQNMLNDTESFVNELESSSDSNVDRLFDALNYIGEGMDAIDLMLEHEFTDPEFEQGRTALSSSVRQTLDSFNEILHSADEYRDAYDKIKDIANDANIFGNSAVSFVDSFYNEKDMYQDVSGKDTDNDKEGKVKSCLNYGDVEGDINIGGIAGAMSIESDLNPEDDFDIIGATSLDMTYQVKAVIDNSVNHGMLFVKRYNAGGICGNENLGLIKNSINYGMLNCEDGNYIGGIAGKSKALLNKNYAKCFIYGNDYVGGIAGSSLKGDSNGSLAQILTYTSNAGAVFGNYGNISDEIIEKAKDIKNNWYVYDDLAAIDGISYANKAFKISDEEMLKKDIDESLKKVNVIFMDDNEEVYKKTLELGDSLKNEDVPDRVINNNEYQNWIGFDMDLLKNIRKDYLFICGYDDVYPSISTFESPLANVVANGKFTAKDSVNVVKTGEAPYVGCMNYVTYEINVDYSIDSDLESFCIYNNGYKKYKVYVKNDGIWKEIKYKEDGRYAVIEDSSIKTVSIVRYNNTTMYIIIAAIISIVIIDVILFIKKKRKIKKIRN